MRETATDSKPLKVSDFFELRLDVRFPKYARTPLSQENAPWPLDRLLQTSDGPPCPVGNDRLPKLAGLEVLRTCLADGVQQRVFGLASGSDWAADDAVLRFGDGVEPNEIQFQPGTWLVRAGVIKELVASRGAEPVEVEGGSIAPGVDESEEEEEVLGKSGPGDTIRSVTVSIRRCLRRRPGK
jgi:hypothetical protein